MSQLGSGDFTQIARRMRLQEEQLKEVLNDEEAIDLPPFLRNRRAAYARSRNGAGAR